MTALVPTTRRETETSGFEIHGNALLLAKLEPVDLENLTVHAL
jgi:hypothetical protein